MPGMANAPSQANDLTTLTLDAVRALLRQITSGTHSYPGSEPITGTYASFSAQALRDLMQCEPLAGIVEHAINQEAGAAAGR